MASALYNAMIAAEEEDKKKAAPKSGRAKAAAAAEAKDPGNTNAKFSKTPDKKPLTGEASKLLGGEKSTLMRGESTPFMSDSLRGQGSSLLSGQQSPLLGGESTQLSTPLLGGQSSPLANVYGPRSAQPRMQGQSSNYPLTYDMVESIVGPLSPGMRTRLGEPGMVRGQAGTRGEGVEFRKPATLTPEEEAEAQRTQSQADLYTKDFTQWEKERLRRESQPSVQLTGNMQRPIPLGPRPNAADYVGQGKTGTPSDPAAVAPAPVKASGMFGKFLTKPDSATDPNARTQNIETRTADALPRADVQAPTDVIGQKTNINADDFIGGIAGKEVSIINSAKKFENNIVAGISPARAAKLILQSTDYDESNPFHAALRVFDQVASGPDKKRAEVAKQGMVALTDYFTRGASGKSGHNETTLRSAVEYLNLSTMPGMTESNARNSFDELLPVMTEEGSRLRQFFGSSTQQQATRTAIKTASMAGIVTTALNNVAQNVINRMPSGEAPAMKSARDRALRVLAPLTTANPGEPAIRWMDSDPLRSNLANDLLFETQRLMGGDSIASIKNLQDQIENGRIARTFGGQFDVRSTLTQITQPNYAGREAEYLRDMDLADQAEASGDKVKAAKLAAPYHTTAALQMMYGTDEVEGYESGRAIGVSSGLGGNLKLRDAKLRRQEVIGEITRNQEPLKTNLTPVQMLGTVFAQNGADKTLLKFGLPFFGGTVQFGGMNENAGYIRSYDIPNHPGMKLTLNVAEGKRAINPITGAVMGAESLDASNNKDIQKILNQLAESRDPAAMLERSVIKSTLGPTAEKYEFGIIEASKDKVGASDDFAKLMGGYRSYSTAGDQGKFSADVTADMQSMFKLPIGSDGMPYIDDNSQQLYDMAVRVKTSLDESLRNYEEKDGKYVFSGKENKRELPLVLSQEQYDSLRATQQQFTSMVRGADAIRESLGVTGGAVGFRVQNGVPIYSQPLAVTGDNRFKQVSTFLDAWVNKKSGAPDFTKLFEGIDIQQGAKFSKTVMMYDVDQDGQPIIDKRHLRSYEVNADGTVNVRQFRLTDAKAAGGVESGDKKVTGGFKEFAADEVAKRLRGSNFKEGYTEVTAEGGTPRTVSVPANDVAVTTGVSTEKSKAASSGRYGLSGTYLYQTFMATHRQINSGLKLDGAAESFARSILGTNDKDVIDNLKEQGITPDQLKTITTNLNRTQGAQLQMWLQVSDPAKFTPVGRAAGTMNATSDPRRTSDSVSDSAIRSDERTARRSISDIVVTRNANVWDSVTGSALKMYEDEGQSKNSQAEQVDRITKKVLENAVVDPELDAVFRKNVKAYVTSLVYNDEVSRAPGFEFIGDLQDFADETAKTNVEEGNYSTTKRTGAGVTIADGRGTAADRRQRVVRGFLPAVQTSLDLINFNENSQAIKSIKLGGKQSGELALVDTLRTKYLNETDGAAKRTLFTQLYKAVQKLEAAGYAMPDNETAEFRAPIGQQGASVAAARSNRTPAQLAADERKRKVINAALAKRAGTTPPPDDAPVKRTVKLSAVDTKGKPIDVLLDVDPEEVKSGLRRVYRKVNGEWVPVMSGGKPKMIPAVVQPEEVVDPTVPKDLTVDTKVRTGANIRRTALPAGLTLIVRTSKSGKANGPVFNQAFIGQVVQDVMGQVPEGTDPKLAMENIFRTIARKNGRKPEDWKSFFKESGLSIVVPANASEFKAKAGDAHNLDALKKEYIKQGGTEEKWNSLKPGADSVTREVVRMFKQQSTPTKPASLPAPKSGTKGKSGKGPIVGATAFTLLNLLGDQIKRNEQNATGKK